MLELDQEIKRNILVKNIKIEAKLWPLEGEQGFEQNWPSFWSDMTHIQSGLRYHQDKHSGIGSWRLKQNRGL